MALKKAAKQTTAANYHKSNMDRIRKQYAKNTSGEDIWFSIKESGEKKIIRVCPPWGASANGFFYYTEAQHFGFSVGGRNRAFTCPESLPQDHPKAGTCPICKFYARLRNSGDKDHEKVARQIYPNNRYFVNIIDREESPAKVRIYGTNRKFIDYILDNSELDEECNDWTDPEAGRDIVVLRKGTGFKTRYVMSRRNPITAIKLKNWQKKLNILDEVVSNHVPYDEMVRIMRDNYAEELKEVGLKFAKVVDKKKAKRNKDEEEDEEEEETEEVEEETEDEEEEESDDETEETEEEEETEESDDEDTEEVEEDEDEEEE